MFLYVFLRTALKSDLLHTVLYTNCPPPYKRHRVVANPILRVLPKRADSIIQVMSKFATFGQLVWGTPLEPFVQKCMRLCILLFSKPIGLIGRGYLHKLLSAM